MKIDGEFLSHLRFADDIFLRTETPQELQHMLQELSDIGEWVIMMVVDNTMHYKREQCADRKCPRLGVLGSWDNTAASRKRTRTKRYNEESCMAGWAA